MAVSVPDPLDQIEPTVERGPKIGRVTIGASLALSLLANLPVMAFLADRGRCEVGDWSQFFGFPLIQMRDDLVSTFGQQSLYLVPFLVNVVFWAGLVAGPLSVLLRLAPRRLSLAVIVGLLAASLVGTGLVWAVGDAISRERAVVLFVDDDPTEYPRDRWTVDFEACRSTTAR